MSEIIKDLRNWKQELLQFMKVQADHAPFVSIAP